MFLRIYMSVWGLSGHQVVTVTGVGMGIGASRLVLRPQAGPGLAWLDMG